MHRTQICLLLLLLAASVSAKTQQPAKAHKAAVKATQPQAQAAPPLQPAPPPPTPEQGPSSPPEVSFQEGKLTILARNSTMADVLNAVKQKTGAAVEMPSSSSERVVGQFGPGAPRDVMAQLLNGSHYDYVLLGSPSDPGVLQKVVLMARANGPEPAAPQGGRANRAGQETENLQAVPEVEAETPEENAVEPPPDAQPPEEPQPEQQPEGENGPTVKTPEQLLRELQQQQQNQSGPPGAPGQPPQ
jgi:hypothetical protein